MRDIGIAKGSARYRRQDKAVVIMAVFWIWVQEGASVYVCCVASRIGQRCACNTSCDHRETGGHVSAGGRGIRAHPDGRTSLPSRHVLTGLGIASLFAPAGRLVYCDALDALSISCRCERAREESQ